MNFYSINDKKHKLSFTEAMIAGPTPDGGLYFPESIPQFGKSFFDGLYDMNLQEIAYHILKPYVGNSLSDSVLKEIVENVYKFEIPIKQVSYNNYALELFHGPTLAFKDVGAGFLANAMSHAAKGRKIRVLVATSGDTGSAVANGFLGIENTEVVVLYPKGKVSNLQQKQFATLGQNIKPIAIEGTFDDCQRLVKTAFADKAMSKKMNLTSANSINVARWIPQSIYYYWAVAQLAKGHAPVTFSVPSGNLGNLTAGLLAHKTGLPVDGFIAASNSNDIVPSYLRTGAYEPKASVQTIANAMDVGDPNNFPRLTELYGNNYEAISAKIGGKSYSDDEIRNLLLKTYQTTGYLADPHGVTGLGALQSLKPEGNVGVFLETAHPAKFTDDVSAALGFLIPLPKRLAEFAKREIVSDELPADFKGFKAYLESSFEA